MEEVGGLKRQGHQRLGSSRQTRSQGTIAEWGGRGVANNHCHLRLPLGMSTSSWYLLAPLITSTTTNREDIPLIISVKETEAQNV